MKRESSMLYSVPPVTASPLAIAAIGVSEAIIVQQIEYWIKKNQIKNRNLYDGRYWTYNTFEELSEQIGMRPDRIKDVIRRLREKGIVLVGNYNTNKYDRTNWYSIDYDALDSFLSNDSGKSTPPLWENPTINSAEIPQPIPETNTETTTEINTETINTHINTKLPAEVPLCSLTDKKKMTHDAMQATAATIYDVYLDEYKRRIGKRHPFVKKQMYYKMIDDMANAIAPDYDFFENRDTRDIARRLIEEHYKNKYKCDNDYSVFFFATAGIFSRLFQRVRLQIEMEE